jgi:NAD(P)H-hydrate epimerase
VLKGARTVITDSRQVWLNQYGNEGMAAGGSGDVLTGIIGSLLAQGTDPVDAAKAGVLLHALSGDAAAGALGTRAMKAGDITAFLSRIFMDASSK